MIVDGFMAAVPADGKETYKKFAQDSVKLFLDNGALSVTENWGYDVPEGEVTSMPKAVQCKENEVVVFSWITWPSKEVRAAGWEKIMADESMSAAKMPFDGKRMIFGAFETILDV